VELFSSAPVPTAVLLLPLVSSFRASTPNALRSPPDVVEHGVPDPKHVFSWATAVPRHKTAVNKTAAAEIPVIRTRLAGRCDVVAIPVAPLLVGVTAIYAT
jgi:hypothetical protein